MRNTAVSNAEVRDPLDFYPTPAPVVGALRDWLARQPDAPAAAGPFLDPAIGAGSIVEAMRDGPTWGEAFWHGIEIDAARAAAADTFAENVLHGDALVGNWPGAHVVMNPPFALLDDFWQRGAEQRAAFGAWVACLMPVAWWSAVKRAPYVRPDYLLQLGWRPSFRSKTGQGHKGSQDFVWSVLSPEPRPFTTWLRLGHCD